MPGWKVLLVISIEEASYKNQIHRKEVFQGNITPPAFAALPGPNTIFDFRKTSIASAVHGMLAPAPILN